MFAPLEGTSTLGSSSTMILGNKGEMRSLRTIPVVIICRVQQEELTLLRTDGQRHAR